MSKIFWWAFSFASFSAFSFTDSSLSFAALPSATFHSFSTLSSLSHWYSYKKGFSSSGLFGSDQCDQTLKYNVARNYPKFAQSSQSSIYMKIDAFNRTQTVNIHLGYFRKKICCPKLSKIVQCSHTGPDRPASGQIGKRILLYQKWNIDTACSSFLPISKQTPNILTINCNMCLWSIAKISWKLQNRLGYQKLSICWGC